MRSSDLCGLLSLQRKARQSGRYVSGSVKSWWNEPIVVLALAGSGKKDLREETASGTQTIHTKSDLANDHEEWEMKGNPSSMRATLLFPRFYCNREDLEYVGVPEGERTVGKVSLITQFASYCLVGSCRLAILVEHRNCRSLWQLPCLVGRCTLQELPLS
jgi:hypothetical protein